MKFTVIYDNLCNTNQGDYGELKAAWGFSCLIENSPKGNKKNKSNKKILFDAGGDAKILEQNMAKLGIDPKEIDILVVSHEHWDHINGIPYIIGKNPDLLVYVPDSFSGSIKSMIREKSELITVLGPVAIDAGDADVGIISTGELGTSIKEQSLIAGDTVITGCAHPGIVEIAKKAKELINDMKATGKGNTGVGLIFGGFHLKDKNEAEILEIISDLKKSGVKNATPCHCSGHLAMELFSKNFESKRMYAGMVFER